MANQWFYSRNGDMRGPVTGAKLKALAEAGKLLPSDLIWKEGMSSWVSASKVKGLFPASEKQLPGPILSRNQAGQLTTPLDREKSAGRRQVESPNAKQTATPTRQTDLAREDSPMNEHCYYKRGDVKITATRLIFRNKTFALNGVTSVAGIILKPDRIGPAIITAVGVTFSFAMLVAFPRGGAGVFNLLPLLITLMMVGLGILWWAMQSTLYAVEICTAAREFKAFKSKDKAEIDEIIEAIEQAISDRG
jgi:hypothetical protein